MLDRDALKNFWEEHQQKIFFIITCLMGFLILTPFIDFQPVLSQGDHGRDLYAFQQTLNGATPYKDYWWVYGPLMPYFYSFFLKFYGGHIMSVLLGKALLSFLAGLFFYIALSLWTPPIMALLGALWFWNFNQDFFFTYNHAGGILCIVVILYLILLYIKDPRRKYFIYSLCCAFVLSLIKVNIGLFSLAGTLASFLIIDFATHKRIDPDKKAIYIFGIFFMPLVILGIYALFARGLTVYELRQCFPYLRVDHPHNTSIGNALYIYFDSIFRNIGTTWSNFFFAVIIVLSIAQVSFLFVRRQLSAEWRRGTALAFITLSIFFIVNFHEFLASGLFYRTFWSKPAQILFLIILLATATRNFSKLIKVLFYCSIFWIAFSQLFVRYQTIQMVRIPPQYLEMKKAQIYTGNFFPWFDTVRQTTYFLKDKLKKDESFLAIPYDPLYYYLTEKTSPTRQLIFFEHINIPEEQEKTIIQEIENHNTNYVLLSSRIASQEQGLGIFGVSYCPLLESYIKNNFEEVATFGDWVNHPMWAANHGTKILKRIEK